MLPWLYTIFVFIVNLKNPVDNLTLDEVVKIYKGDITNWKEVAGDDEEENNSARKLVNDVLGKRESKIIEEAGYVPLH